MRPQFNFVAAIEEMPAGGEDFWECPAQSGREYRERTGKEVCQTKNLLIAEGAV